MVDLLLILMTIARGSMILISNPIVMAQSNQLVWSRDHETDREREREGERSIDKPGDKMALNDDSLLMPISERGSKS